MYSCFSAGVSVDCGSFHTAYDEVHSALGDLALLWPRVSTIARVWGRCWVQACSVHVSVDMWFWWQEQMQTLWQDAKRLLLWDTESYSSVTDEAFNKEKQSLSNSAAFCPSLTSHPVVRWGQAAYRDITWLRNIDQQRSPSGWQACLEHSWQAQHIARDVRTLQTQLHWDNHDQQLLWLA